MEKLTQLLEAGKITQEEFNALDAEYKKQKEIIDSLRKENASWRTKNRDIKGTVDEYKRIAQTIGDKFGVDLSEEEGIDKMKEILSEFDPSKKVDEAKVRELEARLNRISKEKEEAQKSAEAERENRLKLAKQTALNRELQKYKLLNFDLTSYYLQQKVVIDEDGKPMFKEDDGVMVPLEEGVKRYVENTDGVLDRGSVGGSGMSSGSISKIIDSGNMSAKEILAAAQKK